MFSVFKYRALLCPKKASKSKQTSTKPNRRILILKVHLTRITWGQNGNGTWPLSNDRRTLEELKQTDPASLLMTQARMW